MAVHSDLVGGDLHYPLGHSVAGELLLIDNTAAAYEIKEGSNSILKIDTTNSSELLTIGYPSKVLVNSSATSATLIIDQDGAGDAALRLDAGSGQWMVGVDNSDSDAFTVSEGTALGTTNRLQISGSGGSIGLNTSTASGAWTRRLQVVTAEASLSGASASTLWSLTLAEGDAVMIHVYGIATSTTETATYEVHGGAYRYVAGSATLITGTPDVPAIGEADAAWDLTIDVSSNDVRVRGQLNTGDTGRMVVTIFYQVITA